MEKRTNDERQSPFVNEALIGLKLTGDENMAEADFKVFSGRQGLRFSV